MRCTIKDQVIALAALAAGVVIAPAAFAGCGGAAIQPATFQWGSSDAPRLLKADAPRDGIVGLWSVSLVAGGAQIDWGYSEWHSDGTEIMNSGGHTPASGNFCLGVWRQSGPNSFHLKHYPLAYNPATGDLAAKIVLTEDVSLDRTGDDFTGTFTQDVYDPTGATLLQHIAGTINGHRVEPR